MHLAGQRISKRYSKKRINLRSEKTGVEEELGGMGDGHQWSIAKNLGRRDRWKSGSRRYGSLTLARCEVPTKASVSLHFLNWTGQRKYNERLMGQGKDREIT